MKDWKLILVRHGDTGERFHHRYIGSTDIPLSIPGRQQVFTLKKLFNPDIPAIRLCSPLARCRETAEILLEGVRGGYRIDPDLREIDFGEWENLTFNDIYAKAPKDVERWASFDPDFAFPQGESIRDFQARLNRFVARLADAEADSALVITHGGVIRFLICQLLQLEPWQYILFEVKAASVTVINICEGKGVLTGLNLTGGPIPGLHTPQFI
jgi:alpha-ribazole phosphatase